MDFRLVQFSSHVALWPIIQRSNINHFENERHDDDDDKLGPDMMVRMIRIMTMGGTPTVEQVSSGTAGAGPG